MQETKESLNKIQALQSTHLEQQLDKFNEERKELIQKIEKLSGEIAKKERTLINLENQKETLTIQMQQREKQVADIRKEVNSEKNDL